MQWCIRVIMLTRYRWAMRFRSLFQLVRKSRNLVCILLKLRFKTKITTAFKNNLLKIHWDLLRTYESAYRHSRICRHPRQIWPGISLAIFDGNKTSPRYTNYAKVLGTRCRSDQNAISRTANFRVCSTIASPR